MIVDAKMTSKNQITIPKAVRDFLQLSENDTIEFNVEDDGVTIQRKKDDSWGVAEKQRVKYGVVNTPEIDWGKDVGSEVID